MVGYNADGPTRDQVLKFMEEKERIEHEIAEMNLILETNNVGMRDPLVDQDGFPRNDIDVYRVRHARNRIICLQNDHKEIMRQIERGLHAVHAELLGPHGEGSRSRIEPMETNPNNANGTTHMNGYTMTNGYHNTAERVASVVEATHNLRVNERPFVKVNFVSAGSPAETAGIRVDDEILDFGSVNSSNFHNLSQIADVVQHSVGNRVNLRVQRGEAVLNISLVPNVWSGRGLLGCNIVPI